MTLLEEIKNQKQGREVKRDFSDEQIEVALAALTGEVPSSKAGIALGGSMTSGPATIYPVLKEAYRRGRLKIVNEKK